MEDHRELVHNETPVELKAANAFLSIDMISRKNTFLEYDLYNECQFQYKINEFFLLVVYAQR